MTVLFFISPAVFAAGMAAGVLKYGIPESVSESYYLLPPKIRLPVFYGWTVPVAVPPVIFRLDISGGTVQAPVFFGCAAPVFVGVAAPFKDGGITCKVHVAAARLCALLTQIWIFIYTPFWIFTLPLAALFFAFGKQVKGAKGGGKTSADSLTFFLEPAAFLSVYIAVYGFYQLHAV